MPRPRARPPPRSRPGPRLRNWPERPPHRNCDSRTLRRCEANTRLGRLLLWCNEIGGDRLKTLPRRNHRVPPSIANWRFGRVRRASGKGDCRLRRDPNKSAKCCRSGSRPVDAQVRPVGDLDLDLRSVGRLLHRRAVVSTRHCRNRTFLSMAAGRGDDPWSNSRRPRRGASLSQPRASAFSALTRSLPRNGAG